MTADQKTPEAKKTESAPVDEVQEYVPAAPKVGEYFVTYPTGIAVLIDEGGPDPTRLVLPKGAALPKDVSVDEIDRLAAVGFIAVQG